MDQTEEFSDKGKNSGSTNCQPTESASFRMSGQGLAWAKVSMYTLKSSDKGTNSDSPTANKVTAFKS
jgi:hypothetical protein